MNKNLFLIGILFFIGGFGVHYLLSETVNDRYQRSDVANNIVLTSLQSTYSLTSALTVGTDIEIIPVFPPTTRMSRQEDYLKKHQPETADLFAAATAIVSIRGAWAGDPLYPYVRKQNIRAIEIDSSKPFDRHQSGVALLEMPNGTDADFVSQVSPYIWLSLNNYLKSADIIANDLKQIFPETSEQLDTNLAVLKREVFKLKTDYETKFSALENFEVFALTDQFVYLTENFAVDVVDYFLKPEIDWEESDLSTFGDALKDNDIKAVVHTWKPEPEIMKVIESVGAKLVVLNPIDPGLNKDNALDPDGYLKLMKQNLENLYKGLK